MLKQISFLKIYSYTASPKKSRTDELPNSAARKSVGSIIGMESESKLIRTAARKIHFGFFYADKSWLTCLQSSPFDEYSLRIKTDGCQWWTLN